MGRGESAQSPARPRRSSKRRTKAPPLTNLGVDHSSRGVDHSSRGATMVRRGSRRPPTPPKKHEAKRPRGHPKNQTKTKPKNKTPEGPFWVFQLRSQSIVLVIYGVSAPPLDGRPLLAARGGAGARGCGLRVLGAVRAGDRQAAQRAQRAARRPAPRAERAARRASCSATTRFWPRQLSLKAIMICSTTTGRSSLGDHRAFLKLNANVIEIAAQPEAYHDVREQRGGIRV